MVAFIRAPSGRLDRYDLLAIALAVGLAVFMIFRARSAPSLVGLSEDDGTYLCTAKALAEGRGYRHLNLPGEPLQTKYPPLYPALLAVVWRLWPEFPQNVFLIQSIQAVFCGALFWLAYWIVRYDWQTPAALALCGVGAALTNPHWWVFAQVPMSEVTFSLLCIGSLAATAYGAMLARREAGAAALIGTAALAGLLAVAAYLTRSIGVSAMAAIGAAYLLRRRWRELLAAVATMAVPAVLWTLWRAAATAENRRTGLEAIFVYELDYAAWLPRDLATWLWVGAHNLFRMPGGLAMKVTLLTDPVVAAALLGSTATFVLIWLVFLLLTALLLTGVGRLLVGGVRAASLFLLFYWGLMIVWPGDAEAWTRFQAPLLPLIVPAILLGLHSMVEWTAALVSHVRLGSAGRDDRSTPPARSGQVRRVAQTAAIVFGLVMIGWNVHVGRAAAVALVRQAPNVLLEELALYIQRHLPPDAAIAAHYAGYLHLRTGRKVVIPVAVPEVIPYAYPDDAKFVWAGFVATPGMSKALSAMLDRELLRHYQEAGVTHVVIGGRRSGGAELIYDFVREHPKQFERMGILGQCEIYRVVMDRPSVP